jgi:V8-like Glu-specific endopeptidase
VKLSLAVLFLTASMAVADSKKEPTPDLGRVLAMHGRFSSAQACPIGERRALTAAHVLDIMPFEQNAPLVWYRFESWNLQVRGVAKPILVASATDLGLVELSEPVEFFPIAERAPEVGERLYWIGFDFDKTRNAMGQKLFSGEVLLVHAGSIIVDAETSPGTSGGCVLNARSEVVGIVSFGMAIGYRSKPNVMGAVGVFSRWLDSFKELPEWAPVEEVK